MTIHDDRRALAGRKGILHNTFHNEKIPPFSVFHGSDETTKPRKPNSTSSHTKQAMKEPNENPEIPRLKGYLRMIQAEEPLSFYPFDGDKLQETQTRLERRKKSNDSNSFASIPKSFIDVLADHRFVCFFIVQGNKNFHSNHALTLRKRLALKFHDRITTLVVFCGDSEGQPLFCRGTGFASFPFSATLMSVLNIVHVPSLVVLDTQTGRPIHSDAALAMEWNDPHAVLDAWEQEQSGLSSSQKVVSVLTLQSNCIIS